MVALFSIAIPEKFISQLFLPGRFTQGINYTYLMTEIFFNTASLFGLVARISYKLYQ